MCRPWYGLAFPGENTGLNPEPTRLDREWELALATNVGRLELEGDQMGASLAKAVAGPQDKASIPARHLRTASIKPMPYWPRVSDTTHPG